MTASPLNPKPQRASHRARILRTEEIAPHHFQLQLHCPALASCAEPGQFIHVLTSPDSKNWVFDPLLRRAFSIMSVDFQSKETIEVLFRVEGRGTQMLSQSRIGDEIDLIGPLGTPFDLTPFEGQIDDLFHVKQPTHHAIVVGGGVGVPPLVFLSQTLSQRNINVHAIIGARISNDVICYEDLSEVSQSVTVATDDGSRGQKGRVTDVLQSLINDFPSEKQNVKPVVYACGPFPMLRAVAQMCTESSVKCQVSLEENMPCGIGVCNGCVVRAKQPFTNTKAESIDLNETIGNEWSPYQAYRRVCVEGPACWADEIDWEHQN